MSDLLAIFGLAVSDSELLAQIAAMEPDRVTVLLGDEDAQWAFDDSAAGVAVRDRLAKLLAAIELQTGATVVGLAGDREQLIGWQFDRELSPRVPVAA